MYVLGLRSSSRLSTHAPSCRLQLHKSPPKSIPLTSIATQAHVCDLRLRRVVPKHYNDLPSSSQASVDPARVAIINHIYTSIPHPRNTHNQPTTKSMATTNRPAAPSAPPLGFGILGCAQIARKVQRAIQLAPNATVVAVGSRDIEKARRFIAETGLPEDSVTPHGSYEEVLDDPRVEAVYVPLPTSLHVRWAVAAAEKGKHVLLEKPTALCVEDLDRILKVCREKRVQFMDGTMWMHHPRTKKMEEFVRDPTRFGEVKAVHSTFTFPGVMLDVPGSSVFLEDNVRVKSDLDALGALGDTGWYCVRAILWAAGFDDLPTTAIALPGAVKNSAGVLLDCGAALHWSDGRIATFHCSFLAHLTNHLFVAGTAGNIQLPDFVATYQDVLGPPTVRGEAAFMAASGFGFPEKVVVENELPQEALMVVEFARLAAKVRDEGAEPEAKWPELSRKTQLVLDAVKASIDSGCQPVQIGN